MVSVRLAATPRRARRCGRRGGWSGSRRRHCAWADALRRDLLLEELSQAEERVGRVTAELNRRADAHPGVVLLRTPRTRRVARPGM